MLILEITIQFFQYFGKQKKEERNVQTSTIEGGGELLQLQIRREKIGMRTIDTTENKTASILQM
jgi:hypothetical protein